MRLVIGSDHAGFVLKPTIIDHIRILDHTVIDVGSSDEQPADFPDIGRRIAQAINFGHADRGLMRGQVAMTHALSLALSEQIAEGGGVG
ncbi:hypothetical protein GCM10007874_08420 [Labrys miyagiensis]|uniref:Ribose-5-phosphate isomerase n=1 Tax=Labrys miyagiensis TaxID=346912 RepID=A0ABQ6CDT9_9HYPH|nr:RpiB/LacA/LacB family sugar-phosphate isomerase [Labrys miyagiensis]GLS17827.1 hypothetical protein GCM10007874_08420 [Labrys miyagiensis]